MFSTPFKETCCNFVENIIFEKSKTAAKIADMCLSTVVIATVLN